MITYILIVSLSWGKSNIIIPDFHTLKECTTAMVTLEKGLSPTLQYSSVCIKQTR